MRRLGVSALAVVTTLGIVCAGLHRGSADPGQPTTEFVKASLLNQEAACGRSLDVRYRYGKEGSAQNAASMRYIRTPQSLFLERTDEHGSILADSYDRNRGEFRQLHTTSGGTKTGDIDNAPAGILNMQCSIETVHRPLDTGTLIDVIGRGKVASSTESIDGFQCWRIDSLAKADDASKYVIWVDSAIGFCPRKIEIHWRDQTRPPKTIEFQGYSSIGNGVWFPKVVRVTTHIPNNTKYPSELVGDAVMISRVDDARTDVPFTPEELTVQFSSGTVVRDNMRDATYTVP